MLCYKKMVTQCNNFLVYISKFPKPFPSVEFITKCGYIICTKKQLKDTPYINTEPCDRVSTNKASVWRNG